MKKTIFVLSVLALVAGVGYFTEPTASASATFAAGAARISVPCHIAFDARPNGGHVTEQCDFGFGQIVFTGPVVCFAAQGNRATFVWEFQINDQIVYQQVFVTDNGAPGHRVMDTFVNYPESGYNPCPNIQPNESGGTPILKGNFVVRSEQ